MSDISKLTVAKLKSLCREKGLTNYSKLPKPALLQKLGVVLVNNADVPCTNLNAPKSASDAEEKSKKSEDKNVPTGAAIVKSTEFSRSPGIPAPRSTLTSKPPADCLGRSDPETRIGEDYNAISEVSSLVVERVELPTSSCSKRSIDAAFLSNTVQQSPAVPKRLKQVQHFSPSDTSFRFKVPEVPHRKAAMTCCSHNMSVCVTKQTQPATHNQPCAPPSAETRKPVVPTGFSGQVYSVAHGTQANSSLSLQDSSDAHNRLRHNTHIISGQSRVTFALAHTESGVGMQSVLSIVSPNPPRTPSICENLEPPPRPHKPRFIPPRPAPPHPHETVTMPMPLNRDPASLNTLAAVQSLEAAILHSTRNITIPPSISQRKFLPMISLALSSLDDKGRTVCVYVSKLFRYAVFASAQNILNRWFAGQRLSRLMNNLTSQGHTLNMSNLWPYLRLRQQEVLRRKKEFEGSWVLRFYRDLGGNPVPISGKLWTSPDSDDQFSVALRFTLLKIFIQTRICFALAHRGMGDVVFKWVTSTVVDAQQVLENEIWSITVVTLPETGDKGGHLEETFYVLYQTCEVIGHPPDSISTAPINPRDFLRPSHSGQTRMSHMNLRADWSSYIESRLPSTTRYIHAPLIQHVRDSNSDDFNRGVAKVWLARMAGQGQEGASKKNVAERYVLGCVLGNSVSGEYRSTAQMALEFAGIPEAVEALHHRRVIVPKVNMFIPERHNVESVHFTKSGGLHPALAIIQTTGRQEGTFVLRDNGVAIGEGEKVPEVWMKLLGCSEDGREAHEA